MTDEAAILSGIAHYCGAYLGQGLRRFSSPNELRCEGEQVIDIADWEPHDPRLHDESGFPFVHPDPDRRMWWLEGRSSSTRYWVPISLVHAGWLQADLPNQVPTNFHNLAGLSVGRSWDDAVERACAHVVAHDAIAVWWASDHALDACEIPHLALRAWAGCELRLTVLVVPSTTGAHVRLAIVEDLDDTILSLGFAAHAQAERAGELAIVEAMIQHVSARDLAGETSLIRDAENLGNGGAAGLLSFDPLRGYALGFGRNLRGLVDPMCHVQYGLDPEVVGETRKRVAPDTSRSHHPRQATSETPIAQLVKKAGHRIITVDVTTERVRSTTYRAVRVIIPGFARVQPAAFPLDQHGRLKRAATTLGWHIAPSREGIAYPGW